MLAGWLDPSVAADRAVSVGARMQAAARPAGAGGLRAGERARDHLYDGAGLLAAGSPRESDLVEDGPVAVAIIGQPRWTSGELSALAGESGHAPALIEAYRRHGDDFFRFLEGSFALAIIDRQADRVLLAIDRYGIQRLCASQTPAGLVFASNADAVRAHPSVTSTISRQAIFDFLYFGISPSPGMIYREQFKLLPGQYLLFEAGRLSAGFYWRMPYAAESGPLSPDVPSALMTHLRVAVGRNVAGEDPAKLGAFLSGGLDSSTVSGLLAEALAQAGARAKTFTIGFDQAKYDEREYAEIAARHFNTEHHNYSLTALDVVEFLTKLADYSDEPFGNSSVVPSYYCAKMAAEHGVEKILAGDGGDEIFAGNSRYVEQQILEMYQRAPHAMRRRFIEPALLGLSGLDRVPIARMAVNYVRRARLPMPDRMESFNFYRRAELEEVFTGDMLADIDVEQPLNNLREAYNRTPSQSILQKMLHLDLKITLADNDLRKVQLACDMAGVRVAYPFLDDDVVGFSAGLPPQLLIKNFRRRWLFKQAVQGFLPAATLAKRKHGFGMPFTEWPREHLELRRMSIDCLQGFKARGYLRSEFLDQIINSQTGEFDSLVWDIMTLELWLRARDH